MFIKDLKSCGLSIGDNCIIYKPKNTLIDLTSLDFIKIGNNVQITEGVKILGHDYSYSVVTNKYNVLYRPQKETIIGNNVFIGMNSIILMGSNIGNNVIIGAGSVVHGIVDSDSVYAGNPAKKICTLDEYKEKIEKKYESSALCYYKNSYSKTKNMNIYKSLYTNENEMIEYINTIKPKGMDESILKSIVFKKSYDSLEDFLNKNMNGDV